MPTEVEFRVDFMAFVDFNGDELFPWYDDVNQRIVQPPHEYDDQDDEPMIYTAPFLAVYDDDQARKEKVENWTEAGGYDELVGSPTALGGYFKEGFISTHADPIHFNKYTGVVLK